MLIVQTKVQSWVSTLLAIYGAGTLVFARKWSSKISRTPVQHSSAEVHLPKSTFTNLTPNGQQSAAGSQTVSPPADGP